MTSKDFEAAIERGLAAHHAQRFDVALVNYQTALEILPGDAEALSFSGLALSELGRFGEAEPLLRKAVETEPEQMPLRFNLISMLQKQGRFDDAIDEIQHIVDRNPKHPRAWERLGDIAVAQQKLEGATQAYTRSLAGELNFDVAMKLARAFAALGRYENAHVALGLAADLHPDDERVLVLKADVLAAERKWKELGTLARAWVEAAPESGPGWRNVALAAYEHGLYNEAADATRKMMERSSRSAIELAVYAQICMQMDDFAAAGAALDEAEALDPELADTLAARGRLLTFLGRFDEAETCCRRTLARDPARGETYWTLGLLTRGRFEDSEMAAMERLTGDETASLEQRGMAAFALGHGYDARGDAGRAFGAFERAHARYRDRAVQEGISYDPAGHEIYTGKLMELFAAPPPEGRTRHAGPRPVFILGMPRSGTTLIESMLSAHSRVLACGERPRMQQILGYYLARMNADGARDPGEDQLKEWAEAYYQDVSVPAGVDRMTDKHPLNFAAAGLIARVFPDAVILHARRNPVETCLSIWRHEFPKFWTFANRLEDIGHFYGQYARLMAHWQRVLGPRFITVQHEDFSSNFAQAAPKLVEACGLEWEEACANFQTAKKTVATLSAIEVREAVKPPAPRAPLYGERLAPLADALRKAGVDLKTGAAIGN